MPERLLPQVEQPHNERTLSRLGRIAITATKLINDFRRYLTDQLIGPAIEPDLSKPLFDKTGRISKEQPEAVREYLKRTQLVSLEEYPPMIPSPFDRSTKR